MEDAAYVRRAWEMKELYKFLLKKTEGEKLLEKCIGNSDFEQMLNNMSVKTWDGFFLLWTGSICELL
jgi:hypothetical protein